MVVSDDATKAYDQLLPAEVRGVFHEKFTKFTNVQIRSGTELLSYNDVIVESPTGSGKTLAFLLPLFTILKKKGQFAKTEFGAVIISPSRELCNQIREVAKPYAEKLGYTIEMAIGGNSPDKNLRKINNSECTILIATPGRLYQLLQIDKDDRIRRSLKSVEILIVDEADRFSESQFELHIKEIMAAIPRQRRTGLFSATQAKEREDLAFFGLRNPKTIKLKESSEIVCPVSLSNFYTVCNAAEKLICLVEFIRSKKDKKILVFFPSCGGVRYFKKIMEHTLTKRSLFAVHGKNTQKQRQDQISAFRKSENGVMFSTDLMARGIDIEDIDWVVQFEVPKLSSWFIHRAGRTGRNGREGNGLLLLSKEQLAYVNFVSKHEKVTFEEIKVPTCSAAKAEELREKTMKLACADREILEQGTRAYVSHIESYVKHDCNIVCGLKDLDVSGIAHAYGLLRLPKMRELSGRKDLENFKRSDVETSTIKYANEKLEKNRDQVMSDKHDKKVTVLKEKAKEKAEKDKKRAKSGKPPVPEKKYTKTKDEIVADVKAEKNLKRKAAKEDKADKDDFANDVRLLQKIKRGRLTAKERNAIKF